MHTNIPLKEIMSSPVTALHLEDTVDRVDEIFQTNPFHHIPIVNDLGLLVGIVSRTDFHKISYGMTLFHLQQREVVNKALYRSLLIKDIMTKDVVSLQAQDSLEEAVSLLEKNIFHAVPIVEKGQLVGIVSTQDLLRYAYRTKEI